jgi:hypothetical protein
MAPPNPYCLEFGPNTFEGAIFRPAKRASGQTLIGV